MSASPPLRPENNLIKVVLRPRRPTLDERRIASRDKRWPNSEDLVWSRKKQDGFASIPRLLPLIMVLIRDLTKKNDPTAVYWDLWARVFDEGFISVKNPAELAYSSGYRGQRAVRTWTERMRELKELGFIDFQPSPGSEIAHVLLINPITRACQLRLEGRASDEWWSAFIDRADEVGTQLPELGPM